VSEPESLLGVRVNNGDLSSAGCLVAGKVDDELLFIVAVVSMVSNIVSSFAFALLLLLLLLMLLVLHVDDPNKFRDVVL
jgi:hypothetical protein